MQCAEYNHWRQYKHLDLDPRTLRILHEGIAALIADYARIRSEMTTDEQHQIWDETFAVDASDLKAALDEIKEKLNAHS